VTPASPQRDAVDAVGLVRLDDDEYAVTLPPGKHRGLSDGSDPVRAAQSLTEGLATRVSAGIGLLRATAGLGFRLVGLGRVPLAIAAGPLGRATLPQKPEPDRPALAFRSLGEDIEPTSDEIERAFPHASDRIVVFVPGLGEDEAIWRRGHDQVGGSYSSRLASMLEYTPVHLRADDTVPIAQSAVALSALLQKLVDGWPTDVRRIALIGHAGGGLLARGACGVLAGGERPWTELVTEVVVLGTPHLAARPQRLARELGRQLDQRLAGIMTADDALVDVPPLDGVRYVVVTDRVTVNQHPAGRFLGDLVWWRQRATRRPRRARDLFPTAERHQVSTSELPLVNHPEVHNALLLWLA
jgi:hypothetical protein